MRRRSAELEFSKIVPLRRLEDYQPPKKRKYTGIRLVVKQIKEITRTGRFASIFYNIKYDEVLCYPEGLKQPTDYQKFIIAFFTPSGERDLRKWLDRIIEEKGYNNIQFT